MHGETYSQRIIDAKGNAYVVKCQTVIFFATLLVWILNILNVFIINKRIMTIGVLGSFIPEIANIIMLKKVNLEAKWVKYVTITLFTIGLIIINIALTYHTVLIMVVPLLIASQYINQRVIWFSYGLVVVSMIIIVMAGYHLGVCDANMIILTTENTDYYIALSEAGKLVGVEIANTNPWVTLPLYYILPRCLVLTAIMPIIRSISLNILSYASYAEEMKTQSEYDEMTQLYNRNKYIEMKEGKYLELESVGVIYIDINYLKNVNDTYGHEAGDELIKSVADCIREVAGKNNKAYRIGGDEFVIVVNNPEYGELEDIQASLYKLVDKLNETNKIPFSIAIGYSKGQGTRFKSVEKEADFNMYEEKKRLENG